MSRRSLKKFEFGKGIYYFNINKGHNSNITIKRIEKKKAIEAYKSYVKSYSDKVEWLGKWDGSKFVENDFDKLNKAS